MKRSVSLKGKIALIGDSRVGKTSLIRRFVLDEFDDKYIHTLGTKVSKIELLVPYGDDIEVQMDLTIFDIIGQQGFSDLVKETFFHGCQGLFAVCDITRRDTLESLHKWITTATSISGEVPKFILVNKKDLMNEARIRQEDVDRVAEMYQCSYIYTSAKTGEFVQDAFGTIATEIVAKVISEYETRRAAESLKERILNLLIRKGRLGASKLDFFQVFKGMSYDDIERHLLRLEKEGLVRIAWRGPSDFSAFITEKGEHENKKNQKIETVIA